MVEPKAAKMVGSTAKPTVELMAAYLAEKRAGASVENSAEC